MNLGTIPAYAGMNPRSQIAGSSNGTDITLKDPDSFTYYSQRLLPTKITADRPIRPLKENYFGIDDIPGLIPCLTIAYSVVTRSKTIP